MKQKAVLIFGLLLSTMALLGVSCASCGRGNPVVVDRSFDLVVTSLSALTREGPGKVGTVVQSDRDRTAVAVFWRQGIFWKGQRYNIHVQGLEMGKTELRGWVCDDNSLVPGYNPFKKRPLVQKSFEELIAAGERREDERQAQQSAAPLPPGPKAGPSEMAR